MFGLTDKRYEFIHSQTRDGTWRTFIHDTKLNSGSGVEGYHSEADALALLKSVRERIAAK